MNPTLEAVIRKCLPRAIRKRRIVAGPLKGQWLVTSWHDYPAALSGRTERPLLEWFAQNVKPGETWLDVGAHYGYTALALSGLVGSKGRVFAFEPMALTAGYVTQTRLHNHLPQLTVLPLALACPEEIELGRLSTERGMLDKTRTNESATHTETFLVSRLDWLWPRVCEEKPRVDGIKIDVQGMEIEALRGMAELLKACRPKLALEVHAGVDRQELLDLLKSLGYGQGAPIEPVEGETTPRYVDNRSYAFLPCAVP